METRPGIYTTEFWTTIFTGIYLFLNATGILNEVPEVWSGIGMAIVSALYALSRGWAKSGSSPDNVDRGPFALRKPIAEAAQARAPSRSATP